MNQDDDIETFLADLAELLDAFADEVDAMHPEGIAKAARLLGDHAQANAPA